MRRSVFKFALSIFPKLEDLFTGHFLDIVLGNLNIKVIIIFNHFEEFFVFVKKTGKNLGNF